ncbi:MAG: nucleotide exchange factor GrpE [Flavobacteriaceae bacterium]|nr:nucleotide exchange factor GrpE [Flavobacteriaceae bacterium]
MNEENPEFLDENTLSNDDQAFEPMDEVADKANLEENRNAELAELKYRNLRLFAEFENFKKRTAKERLELSKYANESLLQDLLPVLDDFERAVKNLSDADDKNMLKGVELIQQKLMKTLENKGLSQINIQAGDDFDVETQEAVTQIDAPQADLKGKIVDIIETGYTLNDKVIRFAKVVVGK